MTEQPTHPGKPAPRAGRPRRSRSRQRRPSVFRSLLGLLVFGVLSALAVAALAAGVYVLNLDAQIRAKFEGQRWALPARVFARPLELFQGMPLTAEQFAAELDLLNYRLGQQIEGPGTYLRQKEAFEIYTRGFDFWDSREEPQRIQVSFAGDSLKELIALDAETQPGLVRLEPSEIAAIYPAHNEDRILVRRQDLPPVLTDALIAVEDRSFHDHVGVDIRSISRALIANMRAGRTVQGGSTITQQLVKNYFLTSERTLTRKIKEALMALLVERRYSKEDILEVYVNEVYLGQDGDRAIHGFGLASRFYFGRPLGELEFHHIALLVGLIRGPSYYDPRRHPERAEQRRALVIDAMVEQGLIDAEDAATAKGLPLAVLPEPPSGTTAYPAFVDLVRRQLRENYPEKDLTSGGLRVFSTLDPRVQAASEKALVQALTRLEKGNRRVRPLQGAAVIGDTQNGEVLAVVGGRDVRLAGFNRALDARRLAGSLLKPAVYLTALEIPERYSLATRLNDATPIAYNHDGKIWAPKNYDRRYHGWVMLRDALARSYNVATVRLGLELGIDEVVKTLQRLGIDRDLPSYPSLLLGAVNLSPFEVAEMYMTLASGGLRMPLRAIREVTTADGEPLHHYSLQAEQVIEPGPAYLITAAMQRVVQAGTASAMKKRIPGAMGIAGKTGTTDDYRDSWFAGFSGNRLAVVWVGRDDNRPTGFSGSNGALPVWTELMSNLYLTPLKPTPPTEIREIQSAGSGLLANRNCGGNSSLPFLAGSESQVENACPPPRRTPRKSAKPKGARQQVAQEEDVYVPTVRFSQRVAPPPIASQPPPPRRSADPVGDFFKRLFTR